MNFTKILEMLKEHGSRTRFKRSSEKNGFILLPSGQIVRDKNIPIENIAYKDGRIVEKVKTLDELFSPTLKYLLATDFMYSIPDCECFATNPREDA